VWFSRFVYKSKFFDKLILTKTVALIRDKATASFCLRVAARVLTRSLTDGGRLSTVDLLVLTSLDQLLLIVDIIYLLYKTSYFNEEVNCTEPSPSVSIPWSLICFDTYLKKNNKITS
jgi:hypothetical protein